MKPLIAASLIAAAVAASGCAPQDLSVFVEGASLLDNTCAPAGDTQLIRGSLDLGPAAAANVLPVYFGHFGLRSDLEPIVIKSGDDTLSGQTTNQFVATSVKISYALESGATVPEAQEPIFFVVDPGSSTGFIQFQMLSKQAANVIAGAVTTGGDDTLLINFQFLGNVRSGANSLVPMNTQPITFPVRLSNNIPAPPACPAGTSPVLAGPCGNAQENFGYACQ
jgi:hypothetical protein